MAVKHGPCLQTLKKGSRLSKPSVFGNFSVSPTWSTRPTTGCGARSTPLWVHRNLFWQLSVDGNLHGSGMSHASTASPKASFRAPWRVGDAVVGKRNAGRTTSTSGHPCPCQSCSQGPRAGKTGRWSLLNCSSCPPDDPAGQGTKLNRTDSLMFMVVLKEGFHSVVMPSVNIHAVFLLQQSASDCQQLHGGEAHTQCHWSHQGK